MSEVLEIRTGREVSEVVERLAREMAEDGLCLPVEATVAEGEWVRFSVVLEDGSPVIEGVGRSERAVPRGGASKKYDLYLGELSFDARNEIMYERMVIAKQASRRGDHTGTIQLPDEAMVDDDAGSDEIAHAAPRNVPPPPPPVPGAATAASDKSPRGPLRPSQAPRAKKQAAAAKAKLPATKAQKKSTAPKARKSAAPAAKKSVAPAAKKSVAPPKPANLESDTTRVDLAAPPAKGRTGRPSRLPPSISDGPYALDIPSELVAHARRLEERLPRKLTERDRTPKHPEAAVLKTALRIGLAALEAISEEG